MVIERIVTGMLRARLPWWWRPYVTFLAIGMAAGAGWNLDAAGRRIARHTQFDL